MPGLMRALLVALAVLAAPLPLAACGIDGAPPAGKTEGSPSAGGFVPQDY